MVSEFFERVLVFGGLVVPPISMLVISKFLDFLKLVEFK